MNNIIINKENNVLKTDDYKVEYKNNKIELNIIGNVVIYDNNNIDNLELNIKILENSSLEYYMLTNDSFLYKSITINNENNSVCNFNYSFYNDKECNLVLNNNLVGNDIKSNIRVRSISYDNALINIDSNGYVKKDTYNNEFLEDIRGLNLENGLVKINPNMFIDTNDVVANHNATIGNINKDYLFYLKSKGINESDAKKLIVNGFINSIMCDEIINN